MWDKHPQSTDDTFLIRVVFWHIQDTQGGVEEGREREGREKEGWREGGSRERGRWEGRGGRKQVRDQFVWGSLGSAYIDVAMVMP